MLILLLVSAPTVRAQTPVGGERLIHGVVTSAADSAPLADVLILLLAGSRGHTRTSPSGRFALRVPGKGPVLVTRIGFAPETLTVAPGVDTITVRLHEAAITLDPLVVTAEPVFSAASSHAIRDLDIRLRPRETAQELLRLAPGLVIAQHAGGGKAEQIFLRGFDADHGTDVAVMVDEVPVNMVSHGHGQGYADLHFVISELVESGEVRKGPYDAQDGDLATAGAVDFRTRDRVGRPLIEARGGTFNTVHGTTVVPFGGPAGQAGGYVAASGHFTDGPTLSPQGYQRFNGFAKLTAPIGQGTELVASASGFDSQWNASGQVPQRAVSGGAISRFGSIDPSEGGTTSRYDVRVGLRSADGAERRWEIQAYGVKYDFNLFSNFTFFLSDSLDGDGINQTDDRWIAGLSARLDLRETSVGAGLRSDWTEVGLKHAARRRLLETQLDALVSQQHGFLWAKQGLRLAPRLRLQLGLRGDLFRFDAVASQPSGPFRALRALQGDSRVEGIVSPKLNLAFELSRSTTLFANLGTGFHSNDARGVVQARPGVTTLPRAIGGEAGGRYVWSGGSLAAAAWWLDLESELVYVGDEGTTEARGRSRRIGLDLEGRVRLADWLWADADANLSRGRLRDEPAGAELVPLAPTFTSTGCLTVPELGPFGGGIRYRHIGSRAADETNSVRALGYTVTELFASWQVGRMNLVLAIDNLFDVDWNEAQFATTSRLQNEPEAVTELHFTPGAGRGVQLGVEYGF